MGEIVLKKLDIDRGYYCKATDPLKAEIVFMHVEDGDRTTAEYKLKLPESLSTKIAALCSEAIIEAGHTLSLQMEHAALSAAGRLLGKQKELSDGKETEDAQVIDDTPGMETSEGTDSTDSE